MTAAIAQLLSIDEASVLVLLDGSVPMKMGGIDDPVAYAELVSIGDLNSEKNKELSAAISSILRCHFNVPEDKFFIKFLHTKTPLSDEGINSVDWPEVKPFKLIPSETDLLPKIYLVTKASWSCTMSVFGLDKLDFEECYNNLDWTQGHLVASDDFSPWVQIWFPNQMLFANLETSETVGLPSPDPAHANYEDINNFACVFGGIPGKEGFLAVILRCEGELDDEPPSGLWFETSYVIFDHRDNIWKNCVVEYSHICPGKVLGLTMVGSMLLVLDRTLMLHSINVYGVIDGFDDDDRCVGLKVSREEFPHKGSLVYDCFWRTLVVLISKDDTPKFMRVKDDPLVLDVVENFRAVDSVYCMNRGRGISVRNKGDGVCMVGDGKCLLYHLTGAIDVLKILGNVNAVVFRRDTENVDDPQVIADNLGIPIDRMEFD